MATKKLKVELELETAKAKKKLDGLGDTGGTSATGGSAVSTAADKLAKSMNDAGDATAKMSGSTKALIMGFSGLAVSLAGNYAASYMQEGSAGRTAVEYGTSILGGAASGAGMGMMFGPWGAAIGGVVGGVAGGLNTLMKNDAEQTKYSADWNRSERNFANSRAWADFMKSLTKTGEGALTVAEKMAKAKKELEHFQEFTKTQKSNIDKMVKDGRYEAATLERGHLATNRARIEQLKSYIETTEKEGLKETRVSQSGVDALSRIGGAFTGQGGQGDMMVSISREQLSVLKEISRKTGGATWQ